MKFFVIGGVGFIGFVVVCFVIECGYEVINFDSLIYVVCLDNVVFVVFLFNYIFV